MSRSLSRLQALLLGGAVFLGLGTATFGVFSVGERQLLWGKHFHLRAGFRDIQGVEAGTRVRVLGKEAGEVEEVELPASPAGSVVLHLRLDGRLHTLVRNDAVAQILAEGMVGGKVVDILPGSDGADVVADDALIATRASPEITDLFRQVNTALERLGHGQGSLGKLLQDDEIYGELVQFIHQGRNTITSLKQDSDSFKGELAQFVSQGRGTMSSLKQDADAIKSLPVIRSYVQDPFKELIRPDCERHCQWFREADLFEPGRAVLTPEGKQRLDEVASWLHELKIKGSEVVIAAYAQPASDPIFARTLTQMQSQAVCDYLVSQHAVHKLGWFSRRKVTPVGCGTDVVPGPEREPLPLPRVEVVVFVPQA
jgi:phospholipid/cholesterol/gamma-HCH transport system substrate-binding protein